MSCAVSTLVCAEGLRQWLDPSHCLTHSIPHGYLSWGSSADGNRGSWLQTLFWAARQIHRNEGSLDSHNAYLSHYISCFLSFQGFLSVHTHWTVLLLYFLLAWDVVLALQRCLKKQPRWNGCGLSQFCTDPSSGGLWWSRTTEAVQAAQWCEPGPPSLQ